jgi:uncharacterized protein (TIGR02246 family)
MSITFGVLGSLLLVAATASAQASADVATIDGLMRAYYEVVSGPAGQAPDRARDETLHAPGAIIGLPRRVGSETVVELTTLAGFYEKYGGVRKEPFYEWELHRITRQFGSAAHVWSSYAVGKSPGGSPDVRGVTSLQLHHDGKRWQIVSWLTDNETSTRGIPADLLKETPSQALASADEAAVRELVRKYNDAREANDPKAIEALFVADADQLVSSGEWRRGRDVLVKGAMASSARTGGTRTLTVETIRMVAPGVAIADARYEISGLADGSTRKMWSTFVVVRQEGGWRISAIRNMLPAPQTTATPSR